MNRRDFLKCSSAAALAMTHPALFAATQTDPYGGWTGKQFKATGFFRVEKDDRWWIVTPDGNAFLSFGINHLFPDLWRQEYNRAAWDKQLGLANPSTKEFNLALRKWYLRTCQEFGFNTTGVHTSLSVANVPAPGIPYMRPIHFINVPHWRADVPDENFLDVFSPEFEGHCNRLAKELALPVKDDPYLLAYSMTDCPLFTEEDLRERTDVIGGARRPSRIGWPRRFRNFGRAVYGKLAYVSLMRTVYRGSIQSFNETYGTRFDSFDALADAENWRPDTDLSNANETRDNTLFVKAVVNRYYEVARAAIQRYNPNHLFVGDKLNANTDSLDTVLPSVAPHVDIVLYQMYAKYEVQQPGLDRWSKRVDKPFINGDSAFTMITDTMPRPYGPVADTLEERIAWTEKFFRSAFARPEFVGWHYCGLIDASQLVARKQDRQHSGLMDGFGKAYPGLDTMIKQCSSELYSIATNGV